MSKLDKLTSVIFEGLAKIHKKEAVGLARRFLKALDEKDLESIRAVASDVNERFTLDWFITIPETLETEVDIWWQEDDEEATAHVVWEQRLQG